MTPETRQLVHELQVHQIELELQNEELVRAQAEVEEGLNRYTDLYEFAPVGYLTLNRAGEIRQVNLTGARLLGLERSHLVGKHLGILLSADSRPAFHAFCTKAFATGKKETCEVLVRPELTSPVAVELVATSAAGGNECRLVATDITARKRPDALMAIRLRLQEFASSRSPKELLQKTLDEVEALTGSRVGFFHYLEADQRTPSLQVWSTRTVPEPGADAGGKQALELVRRHGARISLVVLDITMPEMSGRQTYEAMQKLRPGIKVLLCSGSSIEGHAQALLDSGCNGFIQKPFDAAVLAAKVRELL